MIQNFLLITSIVILFTSCTLKRDATTIPLPSDENYYDILLTFKKSCNNRVVYKKYTRSCNDICNADIKTLNAQAFFSKHFKILTNNNSTGLMTGYYEPLLQGSLYKDAIYKYPLYKEPKDLLTINLSEVYPELSTKRLRGRLNGSKVLPYFSREEINKYGINAEVICYVDSQIDRFFLEVQGSGRVKLRDGRTLFLSYSNQNGHKYRSIGKYLINNSKIKKEDISLASIKDYLLLHPNEINSTLHYNKSFVFFNIANHSARGALGVDLTPERSIAVDKSEIELGSLVFIKVSGESPYSKIVFAQDTGGAIKGINRADMFYGYGVAASHKAGSEKSALNIYMIIERRIDEL